MYLGFFSKVSAPLLFGLLSFVQPAQAKQIDEQTQDDRRLQASEHSASLPLPQNNPKVSTATDNKNVIDVDAGTLLANPELLSRAMLSSLVYHNVDAVQVLLPIYLQQSPELIELPMVSWANAVLAGKKQDYRRAISFYQHLVEDYPNNQIFRARLIQTLFANRQYKEARSLIENNAVLSRQMTLYLTAIDNFSKTNFRVGGNLIIDENINNAPKKRDLGGDENGRWTASEPISAHGVNTNLNISKRFLLNYGTSIAPELVVRGRLFTDAKQYNEVSTRSALNINFRGAKRSLNFAPFYESTYYAGGQKGKHKLKHFSDSMGVRLGGNLAIGNTSQFSTQIEFVQNRYQTRKHLNGYSISLSPSFSTIIQALGNASLNIGLDYQYVRTRDNDDSYRRIGVTGSITKQWQNFGASANVGIADRRYFGPMPVFSKIQVNKEYSLGLSLWHEKLSYKNFTPRLTWQYTKNDSSIALYRYAKNRVFIEVTGGF